MGGTPAGQFREALPQRQRKERPPPRALLDLTLPAPNAPKSPRPRKERPRMNFRRFVDTTMAGIANFIPRLRRRSSNRRRHTRETEVRVLSARPSGILSGVSRWDNYRPSPPQPVPSYSVPSQPVSPYSVTSQPVPSYTVPSQNVPSQPVSTYPVSSQPVSSQPVPSPSSSSSSKGIHVTVNVFHTHPEGGEGGGSGHDTLTVSHFPNHTVDLTHSYPERATEEPVPIFPEPLSLSPAMSYADSAASFEKVSWPSLSSIDSFQTPTFPTFTDFLSNMDKGEDWQDIPGYVPPNPTINPDPTPAPVTPINQYPAQGITEEPVSYENINSKSTDEEVEGFQTNSITSLGRRGRPGRTRGGSRVNVASYPGGRHVGEGQEGSRLVSQVVPSGEGVGREGCGIRCLWDDLMTYLDHYSSTNAREASHGAQLLNHAHNHAPKDPNTHHLTNKQRLATNTHPRATIKRLPQHHQISPQGRTTRGDREPLRFNNDQVGIPSPLLRPGPPYSYSSHSSSRTRSYPNARRVPPRLLGR